MSVGKMSGSIKAAEDQSILNPNWYPSPAYRPCCGEVCWYRYKTAPIILNDDLIDRVPDQGKSSVLQSVMAVECKLEESISWEEKFFFPLRFSLTTPLLCQTSAHVLRTGRTMRRDMQETSLEASWTHKSRYQDHSVLSKGWNGLSFQGPEVESFRAVRACLASPMMSYTEYSTHSTCRRWCFWLLPSSGFMAFCFRPFPGPKLRLGGIQLVVVLGLGLRHQIGRVLFFVRT